ncbi:MAG: hypothetical protein HQL81_11190, partial [Magnetococcales bacterium]|nr:hypothetical protein [Magnetococcales bacterium]
MIAASAPRSGTATFGNPWVGQEGSVFIIAMILLTVLTLIGGSAMNTTTWEEGIVSNT